ncbi:MAG TPA: DUF1684 domain-containing protein [Pseudoxanthomonas sp.]|nr:DUF1684 domain-containing protein [Pseudoxanthomonas sp.]
MKRLFFRLGLCLYLGALAGCDRQDGPAQDVQKAATTPVDPAFALEHRQWRQQRLESLLQPDGWTSLVGLHWLEFESHYIGSGAGSGIRLAVGPARMGLVQQDATRVWFTPERGAGLTFNGGPLKGRVALKSDAGGAPSVIGFDEGRGQMTLIQRGDRRALRLKHADASSRIQFAGLDYWPVDPSWKLEARFVPHPPGKTIGIVDIVGTSIESPNPGAVEFTRDGREYRLEATGDPATGLFLVLADRTSGHGSYSAGRYLDAPAPDAEGRVVLDFNRAYNPPCAFTAFATCPLPPKENRLDLAILAGEKAYTPLAPR